MAAEARTHVAPPAWLVPGVVTLLLAAVVGVGTRALCLQIDQTAEARTTAAVDAVADRIGDRLDALGDLIAALTAFEAGSEEVTDVEFEVFLDIVARGRPLDQAFPGLAAILVLEPDGPDGIAIRHLANTDPGLTIEQLRRCRVCLDALAEAARPTGRIVASSSLRPETAARLGGQVLLTEGLPATLPDGRLDPASPPTGYTVLAVDVLALTTAPGPHPLAAPPGVADGQGSVLRPRPSAGTPVQVRELSAFDTTWTLWIPEPEELTGPLERRLPVLLAGAGALVALLAGTLLLLLSTSRRRALQAVQEATEHLAEANDRLAATNRRLKRANEELAGFAGVVAHDLKSPLTSIRGLAELVRDGRVDEDRARGLLDRVVANTTRLAELIDDLLEYASAGRTIGRSAPVALDEVVAEALDHLDARITQRRARIEVAPLPVVVGDRQRLVEVMTNLVGNALVHVPEDRVPLIGVTGRVRRDDLGRELAEVTVTDNGTGIPPEEREAVLQAFHRGPDAAPGSGTGLGLPTVERIVQGHGGELLLDDAPGGGLRVRMVLPAPAAVAT